MLTETIEKYLTLLQESSDVKDASSSVRLLSEMKEEFASNPPSTEEVARILAEIANIKQEDEVPGQEFYLIAAWSNLSIEYTPSLCKILENEHNFGIHELTIELLEDLGDERAVPSLSKALEYKWNYDVWFEVPRKSLAALESIGSLEAIAAVQKASKSPEELIHSEALDILSYL